MNEIIFQPEYNKYEKLISSRYTAIIYGIAFAILSILNIFFGHSFIQIISGISFFVMSAMAFYSFIQNKPVYKVKKDHHFLKINNERIVFNTGYLSIERKIEFIKIRKLILKSKIILIEYNIGTHENINLKIFKAHQRLEIKNEIKKVGELNNILIVEHSAKIN